jgi:serine phosphatase RsbU (regulator of sigma subunit)
MMAVNDQAEPQAEAQHMQCMEVWGGSQLTNRGVEFSGLDAWVYSKPYQEAESGGDIYYASSCATGRITRLLLADVSGHGHSVADMAADLKTLMRRFVNRLDQTEFVSLLNKQFSEQSRRGIFATAIATTFFAPSRRLMVCNAGHPRPLFYREATKNWDLLGDHGEAVDFKPRNLPLGIIPMTEYEQFDVELEPGDCVISYTDALIESLDAGGEELGEVGLLKIVHSLSDVEPHHLIEAVLKEIAERYPTNLSEDDVTMLVVQANGRELQVPFQDKLRAAGRFAGSLVHAMSPGAERPPFPDLNLANLGGALIPALGRRWRAPH